MNTSVEVRYTASEELVFVSDTRIIFPDRELVVRLAVPAEAVTFAQPGVYLVQLLCERMCIGDTRLTLLEPPSIMPEV